MNYYRAIMYKMTAWTDLVKKIYNANKTKKNYKLKNAMMDAKKQYKKMKKGGTVATGEIARDQPPVVQSDDETRRLAENTAAVQDQPLQGPALPPVQGPEPPPVPDTIGGRGRRTAKKSSSKKSRK